MLRIGDAGERTRITGSPYLPHIGIDGEYYASCFSIVSSRRRLACSFRSRLIQSSQILLNSCDGCFHKTYNLPSGSTFLKSSIHGRCSISTQLGRAVCRY